MSSDKTTAVDRVRRALHEASQGLVERETIVHLVALAAVAREHVLIIGPPGTAKSEAVRRVAKALGGSTFEYLLGRFTEPSEIFGPIDLQKLRHGELVCRTEGMLPEAEIAFLDEVFLGSTAILNTLLTLLNERIFARGRTRIKVPLRVCVGASNRLPDDEALDAFADRFLVHVFVEPLPDARLEDLLEAGWRSEHLEIEPASMKDLDALGEIAKQMDPAPIRQTLADAIRTLRGAGIELSDRRAVKIQRLVSAAAALDGRLVPTEADLWPIIYAVPDAASQDLARDVLRDLLDKTHNDTLSDAAEFASQGPAARASRIARGAEELLEAKPSDETRLPSWKLRIEGVLREIDATFAQEDLPPTLSGLRERLVEAAMRDSEA